VARSVISGSLLPGKSAGLLLIFGEGRLIIAS